MLTQFSASNDDKIHQLTEDKHSSQINNLNNCTYIYPELFFLISVALIWFSPRCKSKILYNGRRSIT